MARIEQITLYKFDELSERAKERARDWFREGDDFEFDTDDVEHIAKILGIEFKTRPVRLMSGKDRYDPCIYWSGWGCQGDGASFEGTYWRNKEATKAIREYAGTDTKLHAIADTLEALHDEYPSVESVRITQGDHRYCHEYTMDCRAYDEDGYESDAEVSKAFEEPLRDFARWIYKQVTDEHEYRQSDEYVDDTIRINEYEFTEDGKIA